MRHDAYYMHTIRNAYMQAYISRYVYLHTMYILGVSHNDRLYAVLYLRKVRSQFFCSNPQHGVTVVSVAHFVVSSSIYTYFTCIHLFHSAACLPVYACVCLRRTLEVAYIISLCVLLVNIWASGQWGKQTRNAHYYDFRGAVPINFIRPLCRYNARCM